MLCGYTFKSFKHNLQLVLFFGEQVCYVCPRSMRSCQLRSLVYSEETMMLASLLKHEHSSHGNLLQQMPLLLGTCLLAFVKTVQDDIKTLSDKVGKPRPRVLRRQRSPRQRLVKEVRLRSSPRTHRSSFNVV